MVWFLSTKLKDIKEEAFVSWGVSLGRFEINQRVLKKNANCCSKYHPDSIQIGKPSIKKLLQAVNLWKVKFYEINNDEFQGSK